MPSGADIGRIRNDVTCGHILTMLFLNRESPLRESLVLEIPHQFIMEGLDRAGLGL